MVCPACGAGAREDANFCLSCGRSFRDAEPAGGDEAGSPAAAPARTASDATALAMARTRDRSQPRSEEPDGPELLDCANCGATNSARRVLCGRCGADLATGTVTRRARPAPSGPRDEDTGELPVQRRRRGLRPGVLVVALSVLVGAAVGGMAAAEVGPFAEEPSSRLDVAFDPEVYPGEPGDLEIAQVLASSTAQPSGDHRYDPSLAADDRLATAWNSDGELRPHGIDESLRLDLARPSWVSGFVIANGYQKDEQTFLDNARLERIEVSVGDGRVFEVAVLDRTGRQVVQLPEPVLTDWVTVTVVASYPGRTYEDLGVSELEVRGWPAVGTDLEAWEAHRQRTAQAQAELAVSPTRRS